MTITKHVALGVAALMNTMHKQEQEHSLIAAHKKQASPSHPLTAVWAKAFGPHILSRGV